MNHSYFRTAILIALPLMVAATCAIGIEYVNSQQTLRQLANEPQEYVVGDAALRVKTAGAVPNSGFAAAAPIEQDPAAYLVFYDASGTPTAGTGILNGQPPKLPQGVLDTAKAKGVDRLTWQPEPGVRQAIVIRYTGNGYVMSGRSLAYTEQLENALTVRDALQWLGTMLMIILVCLFAARQLRPRDIDS